jgi:hypothetical protein
VSVSLHAQQSAQIMVRVGAGVSGLGLETASVAVPKVIQPLPQRVDRFGPKTPPTPQLFFVIIIIFLPKIIMIQIHRPFGKCDIVKVKTGPILAFFSHLWDRPPSLHVWHSILIG